MKRLWGNLLSGIAFGYGWVVMHFQHQTTHIQIKGFLSDLLQQVRFSGNVAWVANDRKIGHKSHKFNGNFPAGIVAKNAACVCRKSSVYGSKVGNSCAHHPFYSTYPKLHIRIHGVFYHHGNSTASYSIGNFLHTKRVYRSSGTNPQYLHPGVHGLLGMLCVGHFNSNRECCSLTRFHQPR
jgi:hypothetical protein